MKRYFTKLKPKIRTFIIVYGTSLIVLSLSVLYFAIKGYPLVTTSTETLPIETPPLYMISIFFPYGILLGEVIWLWNEKKESIYFILLFIECIIIGFFSFIRYIIGIPFSGHMIILMFYLLHQLFNNRFQYELRFLFGIVVLIITICFKIFVWGDPITLLLGTLLGFCFWLPGFLYRQKKIQKLNE
ncbi:MAG: hypothetical protein ACFFEY_15320 [Candidatus Thorarchaeota archaeon]